MLFRAFFEAKLVNIDISARFLGGVAEETKTRTDEDTEVEAQSGLLAQGGEGVVIQGVVELCLTGVVVDGCPEIDDAIDVYGGSLLCGTETVVRCQLVLSPEDFRLPIPLFHGDESVGVLQDADACPVTVLQMAHVEAYRA